MDGTLVDSEPQHYRAWMRVFKELFDIDTVPWDLYKGCIGAKRSTIVGIMRDNYGVDLQRDDINALFEKYRLQVIAEEGNAPMKDVKETLESLRKRGYKMAVASSSKQHAIEMRIDGIGCREYFEILFSADNVKNSKPAPDTFLECARLLGAGPSECIVVEDSMNGTKAAKAAGMYCIGFVNPGSGDQDLSAADVLVYGLAEIPAMLI